MVDDQEYVFEVDTLRNEKVTVKNKENSKFKGR
jgi:small nuclear ribonucleoprotein (snRNP)-like protein